jgi:uncharacterized protein (TIGR02147 family)
MESLEQDYRLILKDEFAIRCKEAARYSMRSFAKDINLSPSRLSEIFSGQHGLSRASAIKVAKGLGYSEEEQTYFCDLVESRHGRSEARRAEAKQRLQSTRQDSQLQQRKIDTFKILSDWYHMAIIELVKLDGFESDKTWIANKLELSVPEVEMAIERLVRLDLLVKKDGQLSLGQKDIWEIQSINATRNAHRQLMEKAKEALLLQAAERNFTSSYIAIPKEAIPEVQAKINELVEEILNVSVESNAPDSLYCLNTQFFQLSSE